jgi:hypothetical protein
MSELIDAVIKTREITADIFSKSLVNIDGFSEVKIENKISLEIKNHHELYPLGWYNPPPLGIAVLLAQEPFERLKYDSLRNPIYFSKESFKLEKETVGLIFFSPINRKTNIIGDIGFTLYKGNNEKIKEHLKKTYKVIKKVAEHVQIGMNFSELALFASNLFTSENFKITKWKTISSDPNASINIGHTIPGSFENNLNLGNTQTEVIENIRKNRVSIEETKNFKIPETCAFTIESRLEDLQNSNFPSAYFHFIVCFDNGKKIILENFSEIFKAVGMDYMNLRDSVDVT